MSQQNSAVRRVIPELAAWLFAVAAALAMGIATLHAVGPAAPWLANLWTKQLGWTAFGTLGAVAVIALPTRSLRTIAYPAFGLAAAASIAAPVFGLSYAGLRRWVTFGAYSVQPAEFAKLALVLALARFVADLPGDDGCRAQPRSIREHAVPVFLVIGTIVPMLFQPHVGAALVCVFIFIGVAATLRWRWWVPVGAAATVGVGAPLLWAFGMHAYQKTRVLSFLDPDRDPMGAGYQTNELIMTVGSGGWLGNGAGSWAHSAPHPIWSVATDLPFAVWAHEHGFVGTCSWLAAHAAIVLLAIRASAHATKRFERVLAAGVASLWLTQATVSIGASLGVMPVMAVSLPLGSYGGSNVVMSLLAIGLVLHVAIRNRRGSLAAGSTMCEQSSSARTRRND